MIGGSGGHFFLGPKVCSPGTLVSRADSVAPVVAIGKTSAGIAEDRRFNLPHLLYQLFADAVQVRNFCLLAPPDAVVDDATNILGEVPVDIGRNCSQRFTQQDLDSRVVSGRTR